MAFNGLTDAEDERLALLIEECGEVIQSACKILRHGYESTNPKIPHSETNREALQRELGDLSHAVRRMADADDISGDVVVRRGESKAEHVKQYLHHQEISNG